MVTAETAMSVLSLMLLVAMVLWGAMAAAAQIRCVDAARLGARAAARSEALENVVAAARSAAPAGAEVTVHREGELVRVRVEGHTVGPGPLTVRIRGEATAMDEGRCGGLGPPQIPPGDCT